MTKPSLTLLLSCLIAANLASGQATADKDKPKATTAGATKTAVKKKRTSAVQVPTLSGPPTISPFLKLPGIADSSSFCYLKKDTNEIQGQNTTNKVKIASVSKLFSSLFALSIAGPQHRYLTRFYYDETNKNMYVFGTRDPFMGQSTMHFIMSEFHRLGIRQINNLYFNEQFSMYSKVQVTGKAMWSDRGMPMEVRYSGRSNEGTLKDLKNFVLTYKKSYPSTRDRARKLGIQMVDAPAVSVKSVKAMSSEAMLKIENTTVMDYMSSPLFRYLKDLNSFSNNYVTDEMVHSLGGIEALNTFYKTRFRFTERDFEFYTGSGLWKNEDVNDADVRKDNLATCEAVMKVVSSLDQLVTKQYGMKLSDIMMVGGKDPGTLAGVYGSEELSSALLAKTGTLNNATALAGEMMAGKGQIYFGIFFETTGKNIEPRALKSRDNLVRALMRDSGGKEPIADYTPEPFLPFDKMSVMTKFSNGGEMKSDVEVGGLK